MKSKMKSVFAIIAVALMVMVAVVPMASVLIADDSSAIPVPQPTPSTTDKGITFRVVDVNGAPLPYATITVTGTAPATLQTGSDGTVKVSWTNAKGNTYVAAMPGFTFIGNSITINNNVPVDSPDATKVFKANETLKTVNVKAKTGEALNGGTITYPTGAGNANVSIYADGKAYVPKAAAVNDADMTYTLSAGTLTKDGVNLTGLTSEASTTTEVTALQSIITITTTDNAGTQIVAASPTFDPLTPAVSGGASAANKTWVAAIAIPDGGYRVTAASQGYTFEQSDYLTVTAYTAKANEKQAMIVVKAGSYNLTEGKITVTGTGAGDGDKVYNAEAGGFVFQIKDTATNIGVTFAVKDDANQAMAVDALADKTFADFASTVTVTSTDVAYKISGSVKYNENTSNVKMDGLQVTFNNGPNKYVSTTGDFGIVVKKDTNAILLFTPTSFITSIVTQETLTVSSDLTYNFIAEQKEKVKISVQLNNTLAADSVIGGTGYEVKLTPDMEGASPITATWNNTDKVFEASLDRAKKYIVTVTDCAFNTGIVSVPAGLTISASAGSAVNDKFALDDANSKGNQWTIKVVLKDVAVSGYLYSKWVPGDDNNRPMIDGHNFTVYTTNNVATDANGFFTGVNVPRGVPFSIYNTTEFGAAEEYWSINIPAITSGATADVTTSMSKAGFDAYGYVKAYQFGGSTAVAVGITAISVSVNGAALPAASVVVQPGDETGRFNLLLNAYQGQEIDVAVTSVTFENADLSIADYTTCVWEDFTSGQLQDKVFADQKVYAGTVKSANGYGLSGTLTFTTSPGNTAKNVTVTDGDYVFAITGAAGVQQLYTVAFKDTANNVFTIWDGVYGNAQQLAMFRASFTPGATSSEDKVVSGTLSTTITGSFITTQPNANFVTKEYILAGTVMNSDEVPAAVAGQTFDFTWTDSSVTPAVDIPYHIAATTAAGKFYYFIGTGSTAFDKITGTTQLTITLTNNQDTWQIVSSDKVSMSDADALQITFDRKGVTITLKDAYDHNITGVTADIYKVGESAVAATLTFTNGVASYMPAVDAQQYITVLNSDVYTLNAASAEAKTFTIGTVVPLVTNEGTTTGKVVDVSGYKEKISGTLVVTVNDNDYEIEVTDGAYSAVLPKANFTHAYLKGGFYALLAASSGATAVSAEGVAADLNADSRLIYGVLKDGQLQAIPDVDIEITAAGTKLVKVTTDEDGVFLAALKDDMPVQTYADVTAKVYIDTLDLGYTLNADDIVYTVAGTGLYSSFTANLTTLENMMVITVVNGDKQPIEGLALTAVTTQAPAETVHLITDSNGQAVVHSAREGVHVYEISYAVGVLGVGEFANVRYTIATVELGGIAYINMEDEIIADNIIFGVYKGDNLVMEIETDEFGLFSAEFPALAGWTFTAKYAGLTDDTNRVIKLNDTHNVPGYYTLFHDYIDFNATEITLFAAYSVAGDDVEPIIGESAILYCAADEDFFVEIETDLFGQYSLYVPADLAVNGTIYALSLVDSEYSVMFDAIQGHVLDFETNEYLMYIPVVFDGKGISGAYIELSDNGYLYGEPIDASSGMVILEAVEEGTFIRAIANGYELIAIVGGVAQDDNIADFNGEFVAFNGIVVAKTYDVYINGETYLDIPEGTAITVAIQNYDDGYARVVIKDVTLDEVIYMADTTTTTFKYWRLADGTTNTDEAITFITGGDQIKAVGDTYAFTAVFEDSSEIMENNKVANENSGDINPTVLILGVVAVIIALIAVIFVALMSIRRKDKPAKDKEETQQ